MARNKVNRQIVEESNKGLYVWVTDDGKVVADEDGNYLNVPSFKSDPLQMKNLEDAARNYGIEGGKPIFLSGHRRVTDEEYEYQKQRLEWGLIPDELDLPAFKEEYRDMKIREQQR